MKIKTIKKLKRVANKIGVCIYDFEKFAYYWYYTNCLILLYIMLSFVLIIKLLSMPFYCF